MDSIISLARGLKEDLRLVMKHGWVPAAWGGPEPARGAGMCGTTLPWELLSPPVTPGLTLLPVPSLQRNHLVLNSFTNYLHLIKANNSNHIMHHLCYW